MKNLRLISFVGIVVAAAAIAAACGGDDETGGTPDAGTAIDSGPRGIEQAGQACTAAAQCYIDRTVADGGDAGDAATQLAIVGAITCLDKVPNGYCTHECQTDTDCCAVPGECRTGIKQVCSPFTNTETPKYCFLSCEDDDIRTALTATDGGGLIDGGDGGADTAYCQTYASTYATCRSSGGGKQNRKVCIPQQ